MFENKKEKEQVSSKEIEGLKKINLDLENKIQQLIEENNNLKQEKIKKDVVYCKNKCYNIESLVEAKELFEMIKKRYVLEDKVCIVLGKERVDD